MANGGHGTRGKGGCRSVYKAWLGNSGYTPDD
jgi:hypothetical protein